MNLLANFQSSGEIQRRIASRFQARRLEQNYTQGAIVKKSCVSLGTLRRFKQEGEIFLKHLVLLATSLNIGDFQKLPACRTGVSEDFLGVLAKENALKFDIIVLPQTKNKQ